MYVHFSSRKLLYTTDRDHCRKSQPIKMQSYGVQAPIDKSTAQLLHRCSGIIAEEGTDWIIRARGP